MTIQGAWLRGQDPIIQIDAADTLGICTFLSADAFVEWENHVRGENALELHLVLAMFMSSDLIVFACAETTADQFLDLARGRFTTGARHHRNALCSKALPSRSLRESKRTYGLAFPRRLFNAVSQAR